MKKTLIFILTYNAQDHIAGVLDRIPEHMRNNNNYEILVIDDASKDNTLDVIYNYRFSNNYTIRVLSNKINQGYGGNQKIGYTYAIEKKFDAVIMLHGDGQYPPEQIEAMISPILASEAEVVFGSRMLEKGAARKGGMPYYKYIGNKVLTSFQNSVLSMQLSEFHSGFRAYDVKQLEQIPFHYNSNGFDFDTDIIIQLNDTKSRFHEIPIPTHYGDEICHVNGIKYAFNIIKSSIYSRVQKYGIFYTRKFDYEHRNSEYESKTQFDSTHTYAIEQIEPDSVVLDIGCADGYIGELLIEQKNCTIHGVDRHISKEAINHYQSFAVCNLDNEMLSLPDNLEKLDYVLLLDVLEHLENPEKFLYQLRILTAKYNPKFIVTTGNIGFIITRFSLLIGQFNYGKRGILDLTHKRLFTFGSFRSLLKEEGYLIETEKGIPVPIPFIIKNKILSKILLTVNVLLIKLLKGLFSFQIAMVVKPLPTLDILLDQAKNHGNTKQKEFLEDKRSLNS